MRIIITGGGTAGHVNPGIAIAKYYEKRNKGTEVLFVGTDRGIEKKLAKSEGYKFKGIDIEGFKRSFKPNDILINSKRALKSAKSLSSAKKIIKEFKPDIIIGCGGYASFPMVYAGVLSKIKTVVLEVNIFPGVTTKILSKKCDKILLAFEESQKYLNKNVLEKVIVSGSPTKEEFEILDQNEMKTKLLKTQKPLVVSFWGSIGAKYMNEKMVDFINQKDDSFHHIHATGKTAFESMKEKTKNKNSEVLEYIYNMAEVMSAADLVICRGGAATLSEISLMAKPSIIVPSPYVAENHQEKNARIIEKAGGCVVMLEHDISGKDILDKTKEIIFDTKKLNEMSENIKKMSNVKSNEVIYDTICKLLN